MYSVTIGRLFCSFLFHNYTRVSVIIEIKIFIKASMNFNNIAYVKLREHIKKNWDICSWENIDKNDHYLKFISFERNFTNDYFC